MSVERYRASMTEAQLLAGLKAAAQQLGFLVYHPAYSIGSDAGYPDLTILGHGRLLVFELKGPRGQLRPGQQEWIDAYRAAGVEARVIWPGDYDTALELLETGYRQALEGGGDGE